MYLDTSIIHRHLFGTSLYQKYLNKEFKGNKLHVTNYILMEFRRGFLINLIEFYYTLNLNTIYSADDALKLWSNRFQLRSHKNIELFVSDLIKERGIDKELNSDKVKLSIFIADYIKRINRKILRIYKNDVIDNTNCSRAKVNFKFNIRDSYEYLKKIKIDFNDVKKHRKKCSIDKVIFSKNRAALNNFIANKASYSGSQADGFKKICDNLQLILNGGKDKLTCQKCSKIGDAVIALSCPKKYSLNHIDYSFDYLCSLLNKKNTKHPSENELHKNTSKYI